MGVLNLTKRLGVYYQIMDRQARGGAVGFAIGSALFLGYEYGTGQEFLSTGQNQAGILIVVISTIVGILITKNN